jgi:hypothetical protein
MYKIKTLFFFYGEQYIMAFPDFPFFLLQAGSNTTTITRNHYRHLPTLSPEHLNLSSLVDCPPSPTLLTYLLKPVPKNL